MAQHGDGQGMETLVDVLELEIGINQCLKQVIYELLCECHTEKEIMEKYGLPEARCAELSALWEVLHEEKQMRENGN